MKGLTIKLPQAVADGLKEEARRSGRSVAAIVRDRLEIPLHQSNTVYALTEDLAGSLAGGREPATNARKKFQRR